MRRFLYGVVMLIGIYLVVSLSKSVWDLWSRQGRIGEAQNALSLEEKKYQELVLKKEYVEKEEFVEREARERLLLGKPGETRVLIDQDLLKIVEGTGPAEVTKDHRPNWQKWLELFFK